MSSIDSTIRAHLLARDLSRLPGELDRAKAAIVGRLSTTAEIMLVSSIESLLRHNAPALADLERAGKYPEELTVDEVEEELLLAEKRCARLRELIHFRGVQPCT